jgi:hypothetical protein
MAEFAVNPLEVGMAAVEDGQGDDFGDLVGVDALELADEGVEAVAAGL